MTSPDKRTRPLPSDGLSRALLDGRRRRRAALGAGGGGLAAVAALAVLLAPSGGGSTPDSLQLAQQPTTAPPASPTEAPTPEATPAAEPTDSPLPAAQVTGTPDCANNDCDETDESPTAPSPEPTRPAASYTEHPAVGSAPLQCQTVPHASAGPVFTGGASACGTGSTSDGTVRRGGTVTADVGVCSSYRGGDNAFTFLGGREHDVVVTATDGRVVYRFSDTVTYPEGPHDRTVKDGTCATYAGSWDTRTTSGALVPAGSYTLTVSFLPATTNGSAGGEGSTTTTVTVTA